MRRWVKRRNRIIDPATITRIRTYQKNEHDINHTQKRNWANTPDMMPTTTNNDDTIDEGMKSHTKEHNTNMQHDGGAEDPGEYDNTNQPQQHNTGETAKTNTHTHTTEHKMDTGRRARRPRTMKIPRKAEDEHSEKNQTKTTHTTNTVNMNTSKKTTHKNMTTEHREDD